MSIAGAKRVGAGAAKQAVVFTSHNRHREETRVKNKLSHGTSAPKGTNGFSDHGRVKILARTIGAKKALVESRNIEVTNKVQDIIIAEGLEATDIYEMERVGDRSSRRLIVAGLSTNDKNARKALKAKISEATGIHKITIEKGSTLEITLLEPGELFKIHQGTKVLLQEGFNLRKNEEVKSKICVFASKGKEALVIVLVDNYDIVNIDRAKYKAQDLFDEIGANIYHKFKLTPRFLLRKDLDTTLSKALTKLGVQGASLQVIEKELDHIDDSTASFIIQVNQAEVTAKTSKTKDEKSVLEEIRKGIAGETKFPIETITVSIKKEPSVRRKDEKPKYKSMPVSIMSKPLDMIESRLIRERCVAELRTNPTLLDELFEYCNQGKQYKQTSLATREHFERNMLRLKSTLETHNIRIAIFGKNVTIISPYINSDRLVNNFLLELLGELIKKVAPQVENIGTQFDVHAHSTTS